MADDEGRYNGWTNYETWNVALWLGNDEGSYSHWQGQAREAYRDAKDTPSANARLTGREPFTRAERAAFVLRQRLKDDVEEGSPLADQASMWQDLLGAALSEVNWLEIATHWIDDVCGEIDAEEAEEAIAE